VLLLGIHLKALCFLLFSWCAFSGSGCVQGSGKWDYTTREWYLKGGENLRTFKVLVRDEVCIESLKRHVGFISSRGKILIAVMDRIELEKEVKPER